MMRIIELTIFYTLFSLICGSKCNDFGSEMLVYYIDHQNLCSPSLTLAKLQPESRSRVWGVLQVWKELHVRGLHSIKGSYMDSNIA